MFTVTRLYKRIDPLPSAFDLVYRNENLSIYRPVHQRIVSTIHIAGIVKNIMFLSIHIAATATNDIDLAICIAPSRACILKRSICIVGRRRNILNEKYRITYRIVQGVEERQKKGSNSEGGGQNRKTNKTRN